MKKLVLIIMFLMSGLIFFTGCGSNAGTTVGSDVDLLKYIPADATGYLKIDVKALSKLDIFKEIEKDFKPNDKFKDYNDFVTKTGIDLKKDLKSAAVGFYSENFNKDDADFIMVAGLKYDKEKLLKIAKEEGGKFKEETYNDVTLYNVEEKGKLTSVVFADAGHIIIASNSIVKKAVDLFKGKGKSVLDNDKQKSYLKMLNSKAVLSIVFNIPEKLRVKQKSPMGGDLDFTKAECVLGSAWRSGSAYEIDLKLLSKNKEGNDKLASILNMGKMMGASQPDYKELIDGIKINSDENMLNITMTISDAFILKMKDKAKSMMGITQK